MKSATIREIKSDLQDRTQNELIDLCLHLCRFKKENKELLTYLLFEAHDEEGYRNSVKEEIDLRFAQVNRKSPYYVRKSFRSILQLTRKYIRYSNDKETEVELLIHYATQLKNFRPDISDQKRIFNMYQKLLETIVKKIEALHEDLRYDYVLELETNLDFRTGSY